MKRFLVSFAIGASAGCGIAVWLTSRAGRGMRAQVQRQVEQAAAYIKQSGANLRDQAYDLGRRGSDGISHQVDALATGLEAGRRAYLKSVSA